MLFKTPLDTSIIKTVITRLGEKFSDIMPMISHVLQKHRYIIIRGDLNSDESLRYTSDFFGQKPFPFIRAFAPSRRKKSASDVANLQQQGEKTTAIARVKNLQQDDVGSSTLSMPSFA